jgi:hypothetical protein
VQYTRVHLQVPRGPLGASAASTAELARPSPADPGCFSARIVSSGLIGGAVQMLLQVTPNADARSVRILGAAVAVSRSLHRLLNPLSWGPEYVQLWHAATSRTLAQSFVKAYAVQRWLL